MQTARADQATRKHVNTALQLQRAPVSLRNSTWEGWRELPDLCAPKIEDLLQRQEIRMEIGEAHKLVDGQVVLVTGAGGSIGSELCRQIASANPRKLLLLDKSENSLFYSHLEVCDHMHASRAKPFLAALLDIRLLREIAYSEQPDIILHAAAHKHVGMLELHPHEAIRNNVIGTYNIAEVALECGAVRFVNISTDKAVHPHSYMGLSKKLAELCIQELSHHPGTRFSNVRFGNVAGSTGSVIRLFWEQIQRGGPVRVTDPRATRYFMSIPEAVHLILRAATLGRSGETFVFDMGEPINICDLARKMILYAGFDPGTDIPIEFTGLKEGEKVEEELWEPSEHIAATACERIHIIRNSNGHTAGMLGHIRKMEMLVARGDRKGLLAYTAEILPEFKHNRETELAGRTSAAQNATGDAREAV